MKYHIIAFGCQMNKSDAERIAAVFESRGYKNTPDINKADLIAVVMCSVRQSAVNRIYGLVEKIRKIKNRPITVLTGCILKKDRNKFLRDFDYIVDIKDIKKIPLWHSAEPKNNCNAKNYLDITPKYFSKFSANVPIMTGCNNFCSYCVVPYVREREISRPVEEIISEIKNLIKNGYKEIWLLGQNVNSYQGNYSNVLENNRIVNFPKLLKMVSAIPGNFWVRFTSSHPKDFSSELIDAMAKCKKVTPYLNLPIQSGDDKILKAMNRHYTVKNYKNKIKELRKKIPGICLSTDVIVGFPGETKKQFLNTLKLFKDIKYDMAYISKYSPRPSTAAAKLKDNISMAEKKRREKVLIEILKHIALEKNKKYIGKIVEVLVDSKKENKFFGRTKEYKLVEIESHKDSTGKFIKVKIKEATPWKLKGNLL